MHQQTSEALSAAAVLSRFPKILRLDPTGREHRWFVRLGARLGFESTVVFETEADPERPIRVLGHDDSVLAEAVLALGVAASPGESAATVIEEGDSLHGALQRAGYARGLLMHLSTRGQRRRAIVLADGPALDSPTRAALLDAARLLHERAVQRRRSLSLQAEVTGLRRESRGQRRQLLDLRGENLRWRKLMRWLEQVRSFEGEVSELMCMAAEALAPLLELSALALVRPDHESLVVIHAPDLAGTTLDGILRESLDELGLGSPEEYGNRHDSNCSELVGLLRAGRLRAFLAPARESGDRLVAIRLRDEELRVEERELLEEFAWPLLERLSALERRDSEAAERRSLQRRVDEFATSERLARALKEQRLFEQLLDSLPTAVLLVAPGGELRFLNPAATDLLQLGHPKPGHVDELERRSGLALSFLLDELMSDGPQTRELRWGEGGERHLRIELQRVQEDEEEPLGVLIALRDITRRKRLELEQAEFIGSVSHELRTPLTSMRAALELVLQREAGELTEEQEHFLEMGRRNIDRLARLIERLLDVARHDDGRLRLERQPLRLDHLLEDSVDAMRSRARAENRELVISIAEGAQAYADPDRFPEIVENLLANAVKFTRPGGRIELSLRAAAETPNHTARMLASVSGQPLRGSELVVRDDGCGMSVSDRERAFERFHQAGDPLTGRPQGVGLGLAITKALVAGHDGLIDLESELGQGTSARVWVPSGPADAAICSVVARLERAMEELHRSLRPGILVALAMDEDTARDDLVRRWHERQLPGSWPTERVGEHAFALVAVEDWRPSMLQEARETGASVGLARFPADGRSVGTLLAIALGAVAESRPAAASQGGPS